MLLTDLADKEVLVGKTPKGVCRGVGISLKTYEVKYLFCSSGSSSSEGGDFAVPVSAVAAVGEEIVLSRLRPVFPKACAKLFLHRPVYSFDGAFLGRLENAEIKSFVCSELLTDRGERYSVALLSACSDAVILKKEQPYPIGQRVPARALALVTDKQDGVVTKPLLRLAIRKSALVKFTLSLPPFNLG